MYFEVTFLQLIRNSMRFIKEFFVEFKLYLLLIFLIVTHIAYIYLPCFGMDYLCFSNSNVDNFFSIITSVCGFILVAISMNSNSRLIEGNTLITYYKKRLPQSPFKNKSYEMKLASGVFNIKSPMFSAVGHVTPKYKTVEELGKYMEERLKQQTKLIQDLETTFQNKLNDVVNQNEYNQSLVNSNTEHLNKKMSALALDAIDSQVVGSMLVIYSAIINL